MLICAGYNFAINYVHKTGKDDHVHLKTAHLFLFSCICYTLHQSIIYCACMDVTNQLELCLHEQTQITAHRVSSSGAVKGKPGRAQKFLRTLRYSKRTAKYSINAVSLPGCVLPIY